MGLFSHRSRVRVAPSANSIQRVKEATETLNAMKPVPVLSKKEQTRKEWLEEQQKILSYQPPRPISFGGRQRG